MTPSPSPSPDSDALSVRVVGAGDAVSTLKEAGRFALSVAGTVEEAVGGLDADADLDCVLVLHPPSDGELASLVARLRRDTDAPILAIVEDGAAIEAVESGVDDVLAPGDDVVPRIDWACSAKYGADDAPVVDDGATRAAFDAFGEGYLLLDRRWQFVQVNDHAAELLGGSAGDLLGSNVWRTFPSLLETAFSTELGSLVETGEPVAFEAMLPGGDRWAEVGAIVTPTGIAASVRDVTELIEERRTRERYERILETIDDGIYTLDGNFVITHVNGAVTELTGYDREELIGSHSTLLADEEVIVRASEAIAEILSGERESGLLEGELERADGSTFPMETNFSAIGFEDGSYGSVGVVRDITERKRYEQTLTALNRSTSELFRTDAKPEVAQLVVDTATDVLGLPAAAVFLFEEEESKLLPAAWRADAVPRAIGPSDSAVWQGFVEGATKPVDPRDATDVVGTAGVSLPLGEHGTLVVETPGDEDGSGTSAERIDTLVRLLETNAEAALDRVDRRLELKRRERELALRNEELQHLNRLNELLRDVNKSLVEAESREAIERAVCERLASAPSVAFAWIGEYDRTDGAVVPRVRAGEGDGYLDEVPVGDGGDDVEPSLLAARTGDPVVVTNVAKGVQRRPWRRRALACGFRSAVSVPLVYSEFVYGVLTLYAGRAAVFDEETEATFAELGRTTAYAISGVEAKESLYTESVVELELAVQSASTLSTRIAGAVDGELTLEGIIQRVDSGSRLYLSIREPGESTERIEVIDAVERVREIAETDDDVLVEVTVCGGTIPSRVADLGAAIRTLVATPESVNAVVELPSGADVRGFIEAINEWYPGTELVRRKRREQPIETPRAFLVTVEEALTDRQLEVLRTAYLNGYFQWPRSQSGEDVADALGIAQSTFNRHLRVAERKLLTRLFDRS